MVIAAIYIAGTASLLVALPITTIDVIGGIPQALTAIGERIGLPLFGQLTAALLIATSSTGMGNGASGARPDSLSSMRQRNAGRASHAPSIQWTAGAAITAARAYPASTRLRPVCLAL